MSEQIKHKRPKYTLEFKQDAAKLVNEKGPTAASSTKKNILNLTDPSELTRLGKEVEQLRMEREILKKAAVFFAQELQ